MFFLHPCEIFPNKVYVPLAAFTMKMRWERPEKLMTASVPRMPGHASRTGSLTPMNLNCTFLLSNNTAFKVTLRTFVQMNFMKNKYKAV